MWRLIDAQIEAGKAQRQDQKCAGTLKYLDCEKPVKSCEKL